MWIIAMVIWLILSVIVMYFNYKASIPDNNYKQEHDWKALCSFIETTEKDNTSGTNNL